MVAADNSDKKNGKDNFTARRREPLKLFRPVQQYPLQLHPGQHEAAAAAAAAAQAGLTGLRRTRSGTKQQLQRHKTIKEFLVEHDRRKRLRRRMVLWKCAARLLMAHGFVRRNPHNDVEEMAEQAGPSTSSLERTTSLDDMCMFEMDLDQPDTCSKPQQFLSSSRFVPPPRVAPKSNRMLMRSAWSHF